MATIIATANTRKGEPCIIREELVPGADSIATFIQWHIQSVENPARHTVKTSVVWKEDTPYVRIEHYRAWARATRELFFTDFCYVDMAQTYDARLKAEHYGCPTCADCTHCYERMDGALMCDNVPEDNPFGCCYLAHRAAELLGCDICADFEMAAE